MVVTLECTKSWEEPARDRQQLIVIEFLQGENRFLKERLHGKRIRFTDAGRALLARKARPVGRQALLQLDTIPATLMRW